MGTKLSKPSSSDQTNQPTPITCTEENTKQQVNDNLSSYLQACQVDPDVQIFDSHLHQQTTHIINSLASDAQHGFEVHTVSLDSFRQVAGCLIDMNQEVVKVILECKKDIWNNQDLFALVQDYFEYSVQTLDFFTALDTCLKRARDRQLIIQVALLHFEEEMKDYSNNGGGERKWFDKTLQELRNFKGAGDPFTDDFFTMFQTVYKQQVQMFEKLQLRKQKLDKKLKQVKAYRKVSNIIFAATFVAIIICSVVAAAIAAPPVVSALAAAASAPMGGIGRWMNSLWKRYEQEIRTQRELINFMEVGTYITIRDLDGIRVLVDKLEVQVEALVGNADMALSGEGEVSMVIEEIKKKQREFLEAIDDLSGKADKYSRDIRRARTVILQRIIKHPTDS